MYHRVLIVVMLIILVEFEFVSCAIIYRNCQRADLKAAGDLCISSFDFTSEFTVELEDRYERLVTQGFKHGMIVALDSDTTRVVGFLEVGTLPSPITIRTEWEGAIIEGKPDVPYLGNVVVDAAYRRQKIGYRLVSVGEKLAQKWGDDKLFVAVRRDNEAARAMYLRMGFTLCLDESELMVRKVPEPRVFYSKKLGAK